MNEYLQYQVNTWAACVFLELQKSKEDKWRDLYNSAPSVLFEIAGEYQKDMARIEAILTKHASLVKDTTSQNQK